MLVKEQKTEGLSHEGFSAVFCTLFRSQIKRADTGRFAFCVCACRTVPEGYKNKQIETSSDKNKFLSK